jgi:hypothetical protein
LYDLIGLAGSPVGFDKNIKSLQDIDYNTYSSEGCINY